MRKIFILLISFILFTALVKKVVEADWTYDPIPPVTTMEARCGTYGSWKTESLDCNEPIYIKLTCNDTGSGCYEAFYNIDTPIECNYTIIPSYPNGYYLSSSPYISSAIPLSEGSHIICGASTDKAGNFKSANSGSSSSIVVISVAPWYKLKNASFIKKGKMT